ncbi:hypothetical protein RMAECT_1114 [Rickettsia rhipicephali str. Ect]|uniref:Uncharacterized protein n=1 Tax=Rickettsia rhipicephali str. Ect TaxID=1359199 RepID=A0A0F3PGJ3_RICRH|nr:hypothetical protein RMAECT_1114 [Rickettsia rhipicephali str. Ect]
MFLWTPWSRHGDGVIQWVLPVHATIPTRNDGKTDPRNNASWE